MQVSFDPTLAIVVGLLSTSGLIFFIAYLITRRETEGRQKLSRCYFVLAIGTIIQLIFALFMSFRSSDVLPPPHIPSTPPSFSLSYFSYYLLTIGMWSFIPWLDLSFQWKRLRDSESHSQSPLRYTRKSEYSNQNYPYMLGMQAYIPAPPNPLFGMVSWGFVVLIVYSFVRLSSEGESRFNGCKKAFFVGFSGMVIIAFIQSLSYWIWALQYEVVNPFPVMIGSMLIAIPFVLIPLIDLGAQMYSIRHH